MKFIVDAQLPKSLSDFLNEAGFDSLHTFRTPDMNLTRDYVIISNADEENSIVISKDWDFPDSFIL